MTLWHRPPLHDQKKKSTIMTDDLVIDLDTKCPDRAQHVVEWVAVKQAAAPLPSWHPSDFGELEHICYSRKPDLREV